MISWTFCGFKIIETILDIQSDFGDFDQFWNYIDHFELKHSQKSKALIDLGHSDMSELTSAKKFKIWKYLSQIRGGQMFLLKFVICNENIRATFQES